MKLFLASKLAKIRGSAYPALLYAWLAGNDGKKLLFPRCSVRRTRSVSWHIAQCCWRTGKKNFFYPQNVAVFFKPKHEYWMENFGINSFFSLSSNELFKSLFFLPFQKDPLSLVVWRGKKAVERKKVRALLDFDFSWLPLWLPQHQENKRDISVLCKETVALQLLLPKFKSHNRSQSGNLS